MTEHGEAGDPELDELLRLVDRVGPVPPEFEERLRADLHRSLAAGPIRSAAGDERGHQLDLVADRAERRRSTGPGLWLGAAAAVAALVIGLVALRPADQGDPGVADDRPQTSVDAQALPVLNDLESACRRFVELAPDRSDLATALEFDPASAEVLLRSLLDGLAVLQRDIETNGLLDESGIQRLTIARGFYLEAANSASRGSDATADYQRADAQVGNLAAEVPAFGPCRSR